jgi:hypothetical protein
MDGRCLEALAEWKELRNTANGMTLKWLPHQKELGERETLTAICDSRSSHKTGVRRFATFALFVCSRHSSVDSRNAAVPLRLIRANPCCRTESASPEEIAAPALKNAGAARSLNGGIAHWPSAIHAGITIRMSQHRSSPVGLGFLFGIG